MNYDLESKIGFLVHSEENATKVYRVSAVCEISVPKESRIHLYIVPSTSKAKIDEFVSMILEGYQILGTLDIKEESALKQKLQEEIAEVRGATIARPHTPEALIHQIANLLKEMKSYEILECLQYPEDIFLFPPQHERKYSGTEEIKAKKRLVFLPL